MTGNEEQRLAPHCRHFVMRKKRYCRMTVKSGEEYCGEHQLPHASSGNKESGAVSDQKIRIVCPLDPKQLVSNKPSTNCLDLQLFSTCYAHNLKKHLKICNARPGIVLPYIEKGVNSGESADVSDLDSHKLLSTFPTIDITEVISKVNKIYEDLLDGKVTNCFSTHKVVEEEMSKSEYGDKSKKHLKQASAILGLLREYSLLNPNTCYIEFGAGRGFSAAI
jgi:tRNA:m4X modification enzyme